MPIDYRDYHPQWREISRQIRDQADDRCEQCGVENGALIVREPGSDRYYEVTGTGEAELLDGDKVTRVVLTVHHWRDDDKQTTDPSAMAALCNRCHLLADLPKHMRNAAETRRRQRVERGQVPLMGATR